VFHAHIFHTKVVDDEAELKGTPFMAPESRRGGSLIEAFSDQARSQEIVC